MIPKKPQQTKQNKKPDSVYFKEFDSKWGKLKKIGVSNAVPLRLAQLQDSGHLKNGKVIFEAIIPDAYGLESSLHKKYKHRQFLPDVKIDGGTELFKNISAYESSAIISEIQQASNTPSVSNENYSDEYEPVNIVHLRLFVIAIFVLFFVTLYFKNR
jgi:hypothetical protein